MPQKRLSRMRATRGIEEVCKNHMREIFNRTVTVKEKLEAKGYELKQFLDDWLSSSASEKLRKELVDGTFDGKNHPGKANYSDWVIEPQSSCRPTISDFIIWHEKVYAGALVGVITRAIIEVKHKEIMPELEVFAKAWEEARPSLIEELKTSYAEHLRAVGFKKDASEFATTVTIIDDTR